MAEDPLEILVVYDPIRLSGRFTRQKGSTSSAWERLSARAMAEPLEASVMPDAIEIPWPRALSILRDFGTRAQQQALNFRLVPVGEAVARIRRFSEEVKQARALSGRLSASISPTQIAESLIKLGFERRLKAFQLRDLCQLLALPHGANFSVPGAGKTTVTFALHLLVRQLHQHLLVIGPRAAFPAWKDIISECLSPTAEFSVREPFTVLDGNFDTNDRLLRSGATRFLVSYDTMVRQGDLLANYMARQSVHLVLDESHRMKAGQASQRGSLLLKMAGLPVRRDILSGTPMPQGSGDMSAQLGFLWPGHGLDLQIDRGITPREVLGQRYVRTTKQELGIPKAHRHFFQIEMADGQLALYAIVRNEALRQISRALGVGAAGTDILKARRSVMRLLQLSSNPVLALQGLADRAKDIDSGIVDQVLLEGPSQKMRAVEQHARRLGRAGRKVVIWTIFTNTLLEMERLLADMNPVTLYGAVPNGSADDLNTREGRLRRFHQDDACMCMIANPAAAGEGISLHAVCHEAIYLDRSYVSTHYLQSIDRIHRLGLAQGTVTNISLYQTVAPAGLGSIDFSVNRRLATKIRSLQTLLDDPDLHELALDEEEAEDPIQSNVDLQDLVDLVAELEGQRPNVTNEIDT